MAQYGVRIETRNEMRGIFRENLPEYFRDHPGKYVLFETEGFKIRARFYNKKELKKATAKYDGVYGGTFFSAKIPKTKKKLKEITAKFPLSLDNLCEE